MLSVALISKNLVNLSKISSIGLTADISNTGQTSGEPKYAISSILLKNLTPNLMIDCLMELVLPEI